LIFGKIDYLNLLPFYVFLKKNLRISTQKQVLSHKKNNPAKINRDFKKRRIDAAFISSIRARNEKCTNLGIVAKKEVLSVLLFTGDAKIDNESETSNVLAQLLGLSGEVSIGDKALKQYYANAEAIDLAQEWHKRTNLPFVFARLCFHNHPQIIRHLSQKFSQSNVKIPYTIMQKYSKSRQLTPAQINHYLTKITYTLGPKEQLSLKKFYRSAQKEYLFRIKQ
jgi:chorismate dehydratase